MFSTVAQESVWIYSGSLPEVIPMNHAFRQCYRPSSIRLPSWLLRVWGWF